tara:strand:+ start:1670 stop:1903 length:234 start_codon:yes stop_codon:yes gene_type:complete
MSIAKNLFKHKIQDFTSLFNIASLHLDQLQERHDKGRLDQLHINRLRNDIDWMTDKMKLLIEDELKEHIKPEETCEA